LSATGKNIPAIENKPVLYEDLTPDYRAFVILSSSRRIGMTPESIAISDITAYCEMFGIKNYKQRQQFLKRIKILDNTYLKFDKGN
jgi:hypothetical protein